MVDSHVELLTIVFYHSLGLLLLLIIRDLNRVHGPFNSVVCGSGRTVSFINANLLQVFQLDWVDFGEQVRVYVQCLIKIVVVIILRHLLLLRFLLLLFAEVANRLTFHIDRVEFALYLVVLGAFLAEEVLSSGRDDGAGRADRAEGCWARRSVMHDCHIVVGLAGSGSIVLWLRRRHGLLS